ncbi:c-type cytochrome [Sulfurospirillum sp. 1612]|uniref:c-type cytochrome n=1 Tax=Sulfurospirillum sp. 1612 TaxID=3094835 RepID=UPI002F92245B
MRKVILFFYIMIFMGVSGFAASTQQSTADISKALDGKPVDYAAAKSMLSKIQFDAPFPAEVEKQNSEFGEFVKLGYLLFTQTKKYAPKYVGSALSCNNCHLNAGALANSAPMWASYGMYPAYRGKNHLVNSFENRLQGCFIYSENGIVPPSGGVILKSLSAYIYWMSKGVPVGVSLPGRGYPKVKPAKKADLKKGEAVYMQKCAICHGKFGEGVKTRHAHEYQFPPLWGPDSYNWGAGMHKVSNFANFIKANMPLGQSYTLSDQEAWDIAAWVNQKSHSRPTRVSDPINGPAF